MSRPSTLDDPTLPSRITIENEANWLRVKSNISAKLASSLEARLASLPGGAKGEAAARVRAEVERRIQQIEMEAFQLAKPNLLVNGYNYEDFVEATEPWDEALDRKLKGLNAERIGHERQIAEYRRRAPRQIFALEEDLQDRREAGEWRAPETDRTGRKEKVETVPPPPRHEQVKETFNTVVSNLSELANAVPQQLSRAQRAQTVRDEISHLPA